MNGGYDLKEIMQYDRNLVGKKVYITGHDREEIAGRVIDVFDVNGKIFVTVQIDHLTTVAIPSDDIDLMISR